MASLVWLICMAVATVRLTSNAGRTNLPGTQTAAADI